MNKQLESINIIAFIINGVLSIRLLTLPREIGEHAKNNGWMSVLLMGAYIFFVGYVFFWVGTKHKDLTFSQICEKVLGKFIGKIVILGIGVYTIVSVGLGLRIFGDAIQIYLLDKTPLIVTMSIMLLACSYCILKGVKTISIILDILLPLILVSIIILIILSFSNIDIMNLRPVFHGGITPVAKGALEIADPFLTVGIIGYILPFFKDFKKMKKWIFISISICIVIYMIVVLICILSFGSEELNFLLFPTITLAKSIRMEVKILERAESLFMAAWVPITFTTLLLFYLASTLNLKALFNTKKDYFLILSQIPLFFIIALYPSNISEVFKFMGWNEKIGQILIFVIVPVMMIAQLIRERRVKAK
ncbi:endospore germination permease [Clostridium sp. D2Q-11]|uniref:Endospore germination permease n=1 Tax=Anaeromonas frigoriresistens TaxID=2683708 RepID=A0A942UUZ1_9FIRM|nr:endospore germination permease [Anaeromonas frigoriresistens]MBS4539068.1 endospore germination permease [Anaeromonas frigoriresistens]